MGVLEEVVAECAEGKREVDEMVKLSMFGSLIFMVWVGMQPRWWLKRFVPWWNSMEVGEMQEWFSGRVKCTDTPRQQGIMEGDWTGHSRNWGRLIPALKRESAKLRFTTIEVTSNDEWARKMLKALAAPGEMNGKDLLRARAALVGVARKVPETASGPAKEGRTRLLPDN
ncbi:hypothetical protein CYMTET_24727 [Cymbomonas tetramitiformis]|uniref:Uncharacterized protein n=1 Tax=Cymbomonas tetramitiformis TaxID=36881 RepID=A0AAE0FVI4_9CHLO|nr:hypothetical protein CYMTET_40103 [Cymbomonas tetramitiformis]KAK3250522.1 hypothetical protein CYMTET_40101 [Cymbomonas tetramitiformis]KAK3266665.1 hypothetical protein CYMTET_24727 [Cymbomonas tetramitiformis]